MENAERSSPSTIKFPAPVLLPLAQRTGDGKGRCQSIVRDDLCARTASYSVPGMAGIYCGQHARKWARWTYERRRT